MKASEALARRWFGEVWNGRNEDAIFALMAADCVGHGPPGKITGAVEWRDRNYAPFAGAIPDLRFIIDGVVATDDEAVVRWQARGTHTGAGLEIAPSGKTIQLSGMTWFRFRGGLMVEGSDAWDFGSLLRDLDARS